MEYPLLYPDARKRAVYTKAAMDYLAAGVRKVHARIKFFVKTEKKNGDDKAPRAIQPRDPVYALAVGRYLKNFEGALVKGVTRIFKERVIVKGMNADAAGRLVYNKWSSYAHPVAVSIDASRFDQHMSKLMLEFEHSLYNGVFRSSELRELLSWQIDNVGVGYYGKQKVKYSVEGNRMSGDINTGMGNCVVMCAMVWAFLQHADLDAKLLNNGDDCVLIMDKRNLHKMQQLPAFFSDLGFTMVVEDPVYEIEQISFCQTRPVQKADLGYRMVREPWNSVPKDLMVTKPLTPKQMLGQRGAVAAGGLALAGDMPVLGAFYRWLDSGVRGDKEAELTRGFAMMCNGMQTSGGEPSDVSRVSFSRAFNISPCEQILLEEWFATTPFSGDSEWEEATWWSFLAQ